MTDAQIFVLFVEPMLIAVFALLMVFVFQKFNK